MDIAKLIDVFFQGLNDVTGHPLHLINIIQNSDLVRANLPGKIKSRLGLITKVPQPLNPSFREENIYENEGEPGKVGDQEKADQ